MGAYWLKLDGDSFEDFLKLLSELVPVMNATDIQGLRERLTPQTPIKERFGLLYPALKPYEDKLVRNRVITSVRYHHFTFFGDKVGKLQTPRYLMCSTGHLYSSYVQFPPTLLRDAIGDNPKDSTLMKELRARVNSLSVDEDNKYMALFLADLNERVAEIDWDAPGEIIEKVRAIQRENTEFFSQCSEEHKKIDSKHVCYFCLGHIYELAAQVCKKFANCVNAV